MRYLIADKGNNGLHGSPEERVVEGKATAQVEVSVKKTWQVDQRLKEHIRTAARLHELIGKCTELRDAGRLPAARKAFKQVERLQKALRRWKM